MADGAGPRRARRILGPQAQQLGAQPLRRILTSSIGVEIGMGADDRVHDADNLIRPLVRARRVTERHRQRLEETKPAFAIAQMTFENGAPAEFGASDAGVPLARHMCRPAGR